MTTTIPIYVKWRPQGKNTGFGVNTGYTYDSVLFSLLPGREDLLTVDAAEYALPGIGLYAGFDDEPNLIFTSPQTAADHFRDIAIDNFNYALGIATNETFDYGDFIYLDPEVQALTDSTTVALADKVDKISGKGLSTEDYTTTEKTKLSGIASGATANSSDATLLDRANHTGTQAASTITGLATVATSGSYTDLSSKPSIPSAQIQSDWNQANTSSLDFIKNKPTLPAAKSFANPTRSLNTAFQVDSTRDAAVSYSVDVACALSLTGGQTGTVYLRYADDSGHTTNVKEVCRFVNGNTGTLTIGLNITQNNTGTLSGIVPGGKYAKLVTENTTGTPSFTYRNAQEVLL